jgi:uncharacterized membrane protein YhaH (DUF805 family)
MTPHPTTTPYNPVHQPGTAATANATTERLLDQSGRSPRRPEIVWVAGLIVALGAGVATAHGLYEVALAAGTPRALAWLYPLITDGLALVAYATTTRLHDHGRRYAWTIVVTAAGLSGLTQASYLAGGVASAPPPLRFAIGAWPAIAAAVVAHLLYLLSGDHKPTPHPEVATDVPLPVAAAPAQSAPQALRVPKAAPYPALTSPSPATDYATRTATDSVPTLPVVPSVQPAPRQLVQALTSTPVEQSIEHSAAPTADSVVRAPTARDAAPARVRAQTAATGHATRHGALPTVSELMALAQVARGTAAAALKDLRTQHKQPTTTTSTDQARTKQGPSKDQARTNR